MAEELILITGCSGFVASWICKQALEAGYRVRGTVRDPNNETKTKYLKALPGAADRLELVPLDLEKSDSSDFARVVEGVTLVAHTASPFPSVAPKDENELIKPAVEGTLSVLRAVKESPTVKRVVVTSSVAAVGSQEDKDEEGHIFGEKDWTNVDTAGAYSKSKTLAEKAAWDFYEEFKPTWTLCTVNPSLVLGPSIGPEKTTSSEIGMRLLNGSMPLSPKLSFGIVDVRDVARAHMKCLTLPAEAVAGRRFIVCNESKWMIELSRALQPTFSPMGYSLPKYEAPNFAVRLMSLFDKSVQLILPSLGKVTHYDNKPSKEVLQIEYMDIEKTLCDQGHSLIYHGLLKKLPNYTAPGVSWEPSTSE